MLGEVGEQLGERVGDCVALLLESLEKTLLPSFQLLYLDYL